ncbi:hypothetical protein GCM10011490_28570 [Pseudoclavibacter endophyticus]|uniref:Uncharacterized protein n=1 Tax=Pseudoclavibacter endophyticus TaxID=1778590 RepID=A0A6H9WF33_9MICO|nr:hypothetical protein [Pseudoclavibacter endophyticus]KAB1646728.1 hypothetical protein F8O04_13350 [Pseudoclavibacter endophyticus]GGA76055.1 hypothetical protein GCM10011490_28570 [Pseudoclavibacter endophyticus]
MAQPGYVQFTVQGNIWTSTMIPPTVTLNGYQVSIVNHGTALIPVQPGTYVIEAQIRYLWNFGHAALQVQVHPGQTVPVFYGPPWITWSPGALGVVPQKRHGLGWYIGILCVPFAAILLTLGGVVAMLFTI